MSQDSVTPIDDAAALTGITQNILETPSVSQHLQKMFALSDTLTGLQHELEVLKAELPGVLLKAIKEGK